MATVSDLCTAALQRLGVIAAGDIATADDLALALTRLNVLVDSWRTQRLFSYALVRTTLAITANDGVYTIGTGGDLNIGRPVFLERVRLIDTSLDPDLEIPLTVLTDQQYAALPQKALTAAAPSHVYYNPTHPLGTITLWPVPTGSTYQLVVYTPNVSAALALGDTLTVPPGYQLFYQENLALHLAADFEREPSPVLLESARQSKADAMAVNFRPRDLTVLTPFTRGGTYDINSDQVL
jgi:hypothetical protein